MDERNDFDPFELAKVDQTIAVNEDLSHGLILVVRDYAPRAGKIFKSLDRCKNSPGERRRISRRVSTELDDEGAQLLARS